MKNKENSLEKFTTIASGQPFEMQTLQTALEEEGFLAFIPNENLLMVNPFITGAGYLSCDLQVPSSQAEQALQFLHTFRKVNVEDKTVSEEKLKHPYAFELQLSVIVIFVIILIPIFVQIMNYLFRRS